MKDNRLIRYIFKCSGCEVIHTEEFKGTKEFFDFFEQTSTLINKNKEGVLNLINENALQGEEK